MSEEELDELAEAAAIAGLVLSLLAYLFHGVDIPDELKATVTTVVTTLVTGGTTFLVGWITRHTPRDILNMRTED